MSETADPLTAAMLEGMSREAQDDYLMFATGVKRGYDVSRHILYIANRLEALERGDIKKLMICLPPRHSKTETSVVRFIPWLLGKNPESRVMYVTYGAHLAVNKSRLARSIVKSQRYQAIFPGIEVRQDSHAVYYWNLEGYEGGVQACGIDGAMTGEGANFLLLDDLIKNREDAESPKTREKTWSSLRNDVETRCEPDARTVFMTTRWHLNDPAGRYLEEERDEWEVLRLPAIAEAKDPIGRKAGEALWPERWPLERLEEKRDKIGTYAWTSLYRQNPVPEGGGAVKRDWIKWYNGELLGEIAFYGGIDTATSQKTAGHDSALAEVGKDQGGHIRVQEIITGKWSVRGLADTICARHTKRKFKKLIIELNNAGEAIRQRIDERGRESGIYPPLTGETAKEDKYARLLPITPLIENGTILFNMASPNVCKLVDRLCTFTPGDDYDDVDAFVWAVHGIIGRPSKVWVLKR